MCTQSLQVKHMKVEPLCIEYRAQQGQSKLKSLQVSDWRNKGSIILIVYYRPAVQVEPSSSSYDLNFLTCLVPSVTLTFAEEAAW